MFKWIIALHFTSFVKLDRLYWEKRAPGYNLHLLRMWEVCHCMHALNNCFLTELYAENITIPVPSNVFIFLTLSQSKLLQT